MIVKVMRGGMDHKTIPTRDVVVKYEHDDPEFKRPASKRTVLSIRITLSDGQVITLPQDGDVAYFMNDKGDTTDAVHFPPRPVHAAAAK